MYFDKKFATSLEQIGAPQEEGGGGGGGGGGLGGLGLGGGGETPEAGAEAGAEAGTEAGAKEGEESMLLATPGGGGEAASEEIPPPGRRNDWYTTPGAKGKLYKRTQDSRASGARKRAMRSQGGESLAGKSSIFPGIRELSPLTNGVYESQQSNYDNEEIELFKTNKEIKNLIENLEKSTNARKNES